MGDRGGERAGWSPEPLEGSPLPPPGELSEHEIFLAIMESCPDWVFAKDLEHRFLFVNRSFAAAQGLTPRDMIGRRDSEFWGEEQCEPNAATGHQGFHSDDRRAFAGETVHNPHDEASVADGSIRVFDTVKRPLRAPDGRIVGVLCYCRDVTDRNRATQALRESEERFRAVVGNIPGAVYRSEVQPPYRDLFLSEGIRSISGYEAQEYFEPGGPSCGDLILPEDRAGIDAAVQAALDERRPFQVRYRIRHRDGSIRWVSEQGRAAYAPDGKPIYLDGVHIDVTGQVTAEEALREREERLRAIVENQPECVKLLDREGKLVEMNPAGLRMIEADDLDQVRGRPFGSLVRPADRPAFAEMIAAVFRGEPRALVFEIEGLRGTRRILETQSVPTWDAEHREVRAVLGLTRDITERRRGEEARQSLERQLLHSQKMEAMGTLAGGIAHDFNNILAAIMGHAELLGRAPPPGAGPALDAAGILAACERARDLVRRILTFSRKHEEKRQAIALPPVVRDALLFMRSSLPTSIEIRTEIDPDCHFVVGSGSQLHQVLVNLCTNAAHAMLERGGILTVRCRDVELDEAFCRSHAVLHPGRHVQLSVSDTGHGIAQATLERIFEPFFTTKPPGEGTGLGLAVVHGIVQSHEGLVTVESELGRGTSFHVYLPAAARAAGVEVVLEPPIPRGAGEHVLVLDDEVVLVDLVRRVLTELGYRVTGHHRPEQALALVGQEPGRFDLVLCDFTMPGMNGLEVAERIRELAPDLPVLLMSGKGESLEPQNLAGSGIRDLLPKPFLVRTLAETVHRQLHAEPGRSGR